MKKTKSTFILSCRSRLVEYFLEKGFLIIQHKSKQLSSITNEARQIIHDIHIQKKSVMSCYTTISSVANTIKKFHIQSDLHSSYIHNLYHNKQ